MKLLIDECVDERLRHMFGGHECHTARHAGLAGLKNGLLLDAAEIGGFDVLITVDQNIPDQQNLRAREGFHLDPQRPDQPPTKSGAIGSGRPCRAHHHRSCCSGEVGTFLVRP